jgi:hypothetical protein
MKFEFDRNPSCGSLVVPFGHTDRRTDMTKSVVTFRDFANVPKKNSSPWTVSSLQLYTEYRDIFEKFENFLPVEGQIALQCL